MDDTTVDLDRLFHPRSLAMIGASNSMKLGGGLLLHGLLLNQFSGKVYPVNPHETEVQGLKCYPSLADIPGEIDEAFLAVPSTRVKSTLEECGRKGIKFAIIHSAGFSESGPDGKKLEPEIVETARRYGIRIVGPNCLGLFCPNSGMNTISPFTNYTDGAGAVAFVSQSGWVSGNMVRSGYHSGLQFSAGVSIGNQGDLTIDDFLRYYADDPQTRIIMAYIEGVKSGRKFFDLARQITKRKPLVVWKSGRTETAVRMTASHTGSLAGSSAVFDAGARQSGIIRVSDTMEMLDTTAALLCPHLPPGNRVGVLVETAGSAVACADAAERLGLVIPVLPESVQQQLRDYTRTCVPHAGTFQNPVDLTWVPFSPASTDVFAACADIMLTAVDAVIVIGYAFLDDHFAETFSRLRDKHRKPVFVCSAWSTEQKQGMINLTRRGLPTYDYPERALTALAHMLEYRRYLEKTAGS